MFCTKCGKELEEGNVFCTVCGQATSEQEQKKIAEQTDVLGRRKYIPSLFVAGYFLIQLINWDFRIKDYCWNYPGWWINLIIPTIVILINKMPDGWKEKVICYIKVIVEKVLYIVIVLSLIYALYCQINWLDFLGDSMFWLYFHIPLVPMFACFCEIISGLIWKYPTNAIWLWISEMLCMASYVSAYYLVCNIQGDNIKFNLSNWLKQHQKMLRVIMIVLGAIIVYMIATYIRYS